MSDSIWSAALATFRDRLAGLEPVPAGVSAAAVSATLGLGLLIKVLEIASKRKGFAGDRKLVESLVHDARNKSQNPVAARRRRCRGLPSISGLPAAQGIHRCRHAKSDRDASENRSRCRVRFSTLRAGHGSGSRLRRARSRRLQARCWPARYAPLYSAWRANLEQLPSGDPYREEVEAEARQLLQKCETFTRPSQRFRAGR